MVWINYEKTQFIISFSRFFEKQTSRSLYTSDNKTDPLNRHHRTNEADPEAWRRRKGVHLETRKITRTTHVLTLGIKNFRPPPSAAKSDFGKFTTEDPRSTNEEDPEAWRRRKSVHLEIRKITRTTHVLTLGIINFRPPHQQRSRISENSPPTTPRAPMRRILKPGGGGNVNISRYKKSSAPPIY